MVKASVIWDAGVFLGYTRQRLGAVGPALLKWQRTLLHRILWGGAVAQLAEQRAFNPEVVGSIPTGPTELTQRMILFAETTSWKRPAALGQTGPFRTQEAPPSRRSAGT